MVDWGEVFEYRDGFLYWKKHHGRAAAGMLAGCKMKNGYWCIRYAGALHYAHRIIWEMHNGPIPEGYQIDHIWHNRLDNRIENLRLVTVTENNRNQSKLKTNKSGVTGVHWDKKRKKWVATIWINNKIKYLGGFENIVDAITVRKSAEMELGYHENHGIGV